MEESVRQAIKQTSLSSDATEYSVVKLPAHAIMVAAGVVAEIGEAFCALIVDRYEVTLIIPLEALDDFVTRLKGQLVASTTYRLITFDIELDFSVYGFMAAVSRALADAHVPILPIAAYSRDHILVPTNQFDIAMTALRQLQSGL